MEVDPFQLLGIEPGCDFATITAAHAAGCRRHPDLRPLYDQALLELIASPPATFSDLGPDQPAPAAPIMVDARPGADPITAVEVAHFEEKALAPPGQAWKTQDNAATCCKYGNLLQQEGRNNEALAAYNQALSFDAQHAGAYAGRGRLFAGPLHRPDRALADFNHLVALRPRLPEAYYYRARLYAGPLHDPHRAVADYSHAIALNPIFASAHLGRGMVYQGLHDLDRALADFTRVLELAPRSPEAYRRRGHVLAARGQTEEARSDYDRALELEQQKGQAPVREKPS